MRFPTLAKYSLVALIAGASVAWWGRFAAAVAPAPQMKVALVPTGAPPATSLPDRLQALRDQQVEGRLVALEAAAREKAAPRDTTEDTPPSEERAQVSATEIIAMHQATIDRHGVEPLDRQWAAKANAALTAAFASKIEKTSFTLKEIDCRSTTCTVKFEWPSREAAVGEWQRILAQPLQATCSREIVIPEPVPGQTGPVQATLVADCSTWVQQGSPDLGQ